jgi:REP element-mobilizing transposase RayT
MGDSWTRLFVHVTWSTWDRVPLITGGIERELHALMAGQCRNLDCEALRIGGIEDHVHAVIRLHPAVSVAALVRAMKGASSRAIQDASRDPPFRWQAGYAALSVSREVVDGAIDYVTRQREHHRDATTRSEWEPTLSQKIPPWGSTP